MQHYSIKQKSSLLIAEAIDTLRNKPVRSTFYERLSLLEQEYQLYGHLPQMERIGLAHMFLAENISCPVKEYDILLGRFEEIVPDEKQEDTLWNTYYKHFDRYFMIDDGHRTLDWETIIQIGISGYIETCDREIEKRKRAGDHPARIQYLQGMRMIYRSFRRYIERYAEAAQRAGLCEAACICRNIASNPPATFQEGIQLVLFVTNVYSMISCTENSTPGCGRMDDYLAGLYEQDLACGRLTREEAGCIIDDFNCKTALLLGRGEHQLSDGDPEKDTGFFRNPMYDAPTYVILGGYSNHRDHTANPLTQLFLEHIHPRLENPVYVFRHTKEDDPAVWSLACDMLRRNASLLLYNDETVVPSYERIGVSRVDAVNYAVHGCNWPDLQGMSYNNWAPLNLPENLRNLLFNAETGRPNRQFSSIDEIYEAFGEDWRKQFRKRCQTAREYFSVPHIPTELSVFECFTRDCLKQADQAKYAVKYHLLLTAIRYIGTAADMMAALEELIFGEDPVSWDTLADALTADFIGYKALWKRCRNAPKYGRDDDRADRHAVRIMKRMTDIAYEESINPDTGVRDLYTPFTTISDMLHRKIGASMGATPDGRLANTSVSENLSPSAGVAGSVTELLNSVTKLPLDRISAGTLNIRMPKNLVHDTDGLMRLEALLDTYFENGGMQVQLNAVDTKELRDAQLHPEDYPDLMVRITGYSAVFVDMCKSAQDEIIRRDELA